MASQEKLDQWFAVIEAAAVAGYRCPENNTHDLPYKAAQLLCRAGMIRVEIGAHNYRVAELLVGANAGARTAADPTGAKPWKIIGRATMVHGKPNFGRPRKNASVSSPADILARRLASKG